MKSVHPSERKFLDRLTKRRTMLKAAKNPEQNEQATWKRKLQSKTRSRPEGSNHVAADVSTSTV